MITRKWLPREEWLKQKEAFEGKEFRWKEVGNTTCKHKWELDTYQPDNNLVSVLCGKCNSGIQIDGNEHQLISGKIKRINN